MTAGESNELPVRLSITLAGRCVGVFVGRRGTTTVAWPMLVTTGNAANNASVKEGLFNTVTMAAAKFEGVTTEVKCCCTTSKVTCHAKVERSRALASFIRRLPLTLTTLKFLTFSGVNPRLLSMLIRIISWLLGEHGSLAKSENETSTFVKPAREGSWLGVGVGFIVG